MIDAEDSVDQSATDGAGSDSGSGPASSYGCHVVPEEGWTELLESSALADERVGEPLGFERHEREQLAKGSSGGVRNGDLAGLEEVGQAPVALE